MVGGDGIDRPRDGAMVRPIAGMSVMTTVLVLLFAPMVRGGYGIAQGVRVDGRGAGGDGH
jgi:hypothetical protein